MERCPAAYRWACINCHRTVRNARLESACVCKSCLPRCDIVFPHVSALEHRQWLADTLAEMTTLNSAGLLAHLVRVDKEMKRFSEMFLKSVGAPPLHIQMVWARRIAEHRSFAIIAPTGVGKSTFAIIVGLYRALYHDARSLIIVPTVTLADQLYSRASDALHTLYPDSTSSPIVSPLHSRMAAKKRQDVREAAVQGLVKVLIITGAFLRQEENLRLLETWNPSLLFVDDVDAILKGGKLARALLRVAGVNEEAQKMLRKITRLQRLLIREGQGDKGGTLRLRVQDLRQQLRHFVEGRSLVISTATGQPAGSQSRIFREFFGFEVGRRTGVVRNIVDLAWMGDVPQLLPTLLRVVPMLGTGGLLFVPHDQGIEYAQVIADQISTHTPLHARVMDRKARNTLQAFAQGELDILVGVASPYGVLVRGLDLPERVRYVVFVHAPRYRLPFNLEPRSPREWMMLLGVVVEVAPKDLQERLRPLHMHLRQTMRRFPRSWRLEDVEQVPQNSPLRKELEEAMRLIRAYFQLPDALERIQQHPYVHVTRENGTWTIDIPDWKTYLQASGRASRLYAGGITKGLSLMLESSPRMLNALERRLQIVLGDFKFLPLENTNIAEILAEIDRDRERLRRLGKTSSPSQRLPKDPIETVLLIVESPNKARTIARFFGMPAAYELAGMRVYEVSTGNVALTIAATGGHIYDLIVDDAREEREKYAFEDVLYGVGRFQGQFVPIYTSIKRCMRCQYQFTDEQETCPICGCAHLRDTRTVVMALRQLAVEHHVVLVGTDPDTEGEKIAYDVVTLLSPVHNNLHRTEFHEVTRSAIQEALAHWREVDERLVAAQIIRRIDDRWLGFTLSQEVTRALGQGESHGRPRLSAGRVQTPVLGWIIERYDEHERSKERHLLLDASFDDISLQLRIPTKALKKPLRAGNSVHITATLTGRKEGEIRPLPPYSTDALLYDASRNIGLSASQIMQVAQRLFEWGLITYHRTDSTHVSQTGIKIARRYLEEYQNGRFLHLFVPRSWGEAGTHEAIRPTRALDTDDLTRFIAEGVLDIPGWTTEHARVYDLIFRRFVASQMAAARVWQEEVGVVLYAEDEEIWKGQIKRFARLDEESFLDFYPYLRDLYPAPLPERWREEKTLILTPEMFQMIPTVPAWSAGDVIRAMKERRIGRPSTYHIILDTLLKRKYVRATPGGKLVPTQRGRKVYKYLTTAYPTLVSEEATRALEAVMEQVARGEVECEVVLRELYHSLRNTALI